MLSVCVVRMVCGDVLSLSSVCLAGWLVQRAVGREKEERFPIFFDKSVFGAATTLPLFVLCVGRLSRIL